MYNYIFKEGSKRMNSNSHICATTPSAHQSIILRLSSVEALEL